jgi:hypothetical protein
MSGRAQAEDLCLDISIWVSQACMYLRSDRRLQSLAEGQKMNELHQKIVRTLKRLAPRRLGRMARGQ